MTRYLDPDTFETATEAQSWRCDPGHIMELMDTLLAALSERDVHILMAYYGGITEGKWPQPERNEPYHPKPFWMAPFVAELHDWKPGMGKLAPSTRAAMRSVAARHQAIGLHLIRQIMEAYFLSKRQAGTPFPWRDPDFVKRREAKAAVMFRTR